MKTKRKMINYSKYGYLFILPFFIGYLVFSLYPKLYTIGISFTDMRGTMEEVAFNGLTHYKWLWHNKQFWLSLVNTLLIWVLNFTPQLILGLFFAAIFSGKHIKVRGKGFFRAVFYLPHIIATASIASLFSLLFAHPAGTFTIISRNLGLIPDSFQFLRSEWGARLIVCFVQFLMWTGPTAVTQAAGMAGINESLYESAMIDGAGNFRMFTSITLPLIRPILLYSLVTSFVGGLQVFDIPFLLTNGGPHDATNTISLFSYKMAFTGDNNYGAAAASSVYLMIIAMGCSMILFRLIGGKKENGKK